MNVFGDPDAPHGHMHIIFDNVRVPKENMLLGEGRGFEISQLRLGPNRIHHCMRAIGQAEKALDLMVTRGLTRVAFGRPLVQLGGNIEIISRARIEIEAMRLMVLKAGKAMDVATSKPASGSIWSKPWRRSGSARSSTRRSSCAARLAPRRRPRSRICTPTRALRLADGPDEVHHMIVGRNELRQHREMPADESLTAVFRH